MGPNEFSCGLYLNGPLGGRCFLAGKRAWRALARGLFLAVGAATTRVCVGAGDWTDRILTTRSQSCRHPALRSSREKQRRRKRNARQKKAGETAWAVFRCSNSGLNSGMNSVRVTVVFCFNLIKIVQKMIN
jgi:hypothetical protein